MYVIETERLRLRRLTRADREAVCSVLLEPEIMSAMHLPASEEFADGWLDRMLGYGEADLPANWYAERKADGAFVGIIGLICAEFSGARCAELGYLIHPAFQRQGYAYEGAKACMEYAFSALNAHYVTAAVAADNLPSVHLAEKLGLFPVQEQIYQKDTQQVLYIIYALNRPQ